MFDITLGIGLAAESWVKLFFNALNQEERFYRFGPDNAGLPQSVSLRYFAASGAAALIGALMTGGGGRLPLGLAIIVGMAFTS